VPPIGGLYRYRKFSRFREVHQSSL